MTEAQGVQRRLWPWLLPAVVGALIAGGIVGYGLKKETGGKPAPAAPAVKKARLWTCPMTQDSWVRKDGPGKCPACGMDLVPMDGGVADEHVGDQIQPGLPGLATVSVTPEIRQRLGLTMGTVEKRRLNREVRTSARLAADETRLFRVTTKVEGWVEKLFVNVTGQEVRKGDPLLTIYSPELVSAQQEYLVALGIRDRLPADRSGEDLLQAARQRLELWDISAEQIGRLEKTRAAEKAMTLSAAADGIVAEKSVLAGQKIMPGDPLLVIADLDRLWAEADIYQSDLPHVRVGLPMEIALPYWPGKVFKGTVTFVAPTLDPATRTVPARAVIENPERLLKPGMFATARLAFPLGESLAIPEAAVMRTGERIYAFRDGGENRLVPVEIGIGARADGYFQLLSGLAEGDRVVTSANFLVDSESSRKAAFAAMGQESVGGDGGATSAKPGHEGHKP